jgi:hypothetical protein
MEATMTHPLNDREMTILRNLVREQRRDAALTRAERAYEARVIGLAGLKEIESMVEAPKRG